MVKLWALIRRYFFKFNFYFRWKLRFIYKIRYNLVPITLLIQFRNEAENLPGFLANVCPKVNRIIALDDGSSDASASIVSSIENISLMSKPAVIPHHWNEPDNKRLLINEALLENPHWVLVLDADERLERDFRDRANLAIHLAMRYQFTSIALRLAELWNQPTQFRADGIWGKKRRVRLFLLQQDYQLQAADFHAGWNCASQNNFEHIVPADIYIYHLGMLTQTQRERRKQKYKQLDPDDDWQSIGYDYLTDVNNLKLEKIRPERYFS